MAITTLDSVSQDIRDLFHKGLGAMERGNYDYAISTFFTCLEKEPTLIDVRKFLYAAEIKKFKAGGSNKLTDFLTTLMGVPFMLKAFLAMDRSPMNALRTLEIPMRDAPLNLHFISMHCRAAEAADMPELAVQTLTAAREYFPTNVQLLSRLGHLCLKVNQPSQARECFEMVVRLRPADGAALRELKNAMALQSLTKDGWEDAAADASGYQTVRKDTREASILEKESKAVRSISDTDALIEDTKAKIQREPSNINYRRALANLYVTQKMFDEAVETLRQAQELRGSADPELDAGISATALKRYDHQIAELNARGDRAAAEALLEQRNQFFFDDIQQRVAKYPNDLTLRYELGVTLYSRDMFNEAIQQFQLSQRNPRWHIKSLYYLGLCFKAKKQFDLALDQFEKASSELISMDSAKKDVYYEMGLIKEAMDDQTGALSFFKEIYQVDIAYKDVARRVEQGYGK